MIFMGYSILQEILQDAVRFFDSCTAKLKEVSSKSVKYQFWHFWSYINREKYRFFIRFFHQFRPFHYKKLFLEWILIRKPWDLMRVVFMPEVTAFLHKLTPRMSILSILQYFAECWKIACDNFCSTLFVKKKMQYKKRDFSHTAPPLSFSFSSILTPESSLK